MLQVHQTVLSNCSKLGLARTLDAKLLVAMAGFVVAADADELAWVTEEVVAQASYTYSHA